MMNRYQKAECLFSAIGEIDDSLLAEAEAYRPARRKRRYWIPVLAACLAVFLAVSTLMPLAVVVPLGFILLGDIGSGSESPEDIPGEAPEFEQYYASLDELMSDKAKDGGYISVPDADSLQYIGSASIIWQYEEGGDYFVSEISDSDLVSVQRRMGYGSEVGSESPKLNCRVWICDGKGNVRSPYLKNTVGNQDVEVFDYEPEIIPDEYLIDCISDILN